ncbi:aminotransferase class I/II-fold pyridoxal phosphate-dependent enzyme [Microvirga calopogonii]|uniref:aminotransferase class I/II-fold pyridoxal phosphate-dependent enzyme n=1 Tax=Microvirga calopogonii TaxID=2078013 RepID=UPI000E0CD739|nr:aminotransferase class I/II-fold pyridoxal phosphate-dependent enzyme [Microvirga calopogonii]
MQVVSNRVRAAADSFEPIRRFYFHSRYAERRGEPAICDFTFGNPHEMPLPGLVDAIRHHAVPHNKDWFAYKASEPEPQAFLAERLTQELSLPFQPDDIALTNGAFAAITVAFRLLLDAGEEAIFSTPAWFCYEPMLLAADVVPRKVRLKGERFDLDLSAIEAAISPRTRLVIINTPHNPTGRIYSRDQLVTLAEMLNRASERIGRRIFILSDEPYRRIRFDGHAFVSPATVYPWTLISYSYGKVLLAPGQRLGYLALSPLMPSADKQAIRDSLFAAQMALGWCFPNAVMQYAVPDLERLSIDMRALSVKRTRMTDGLERAGYEVLRPEGTFYLFCKYPSGNGDRFWDALADRDVFVMPGRVMDVPGHFRISLTASEPMIVRSLPVFAEVAQAIQTGQQAAE